MKKLALIVFFGLFFSGMIFAQKNIVKYQYCEISIVEKPFSTKAVATINFGKIKDRWQAIKDTKTGKNKVFRNIMSVFNYMGEQGWKYIDNYTLAAGNKVYIFERKINAK